MVGSTDFFDVKNDGQVNVSLRPRQPGSSIKPINYAMALENGFTAATQIIDEPVTYTMVGSPPYSPKNYDGRYHGTVTLRLALANSYNIPAVKTLNEFGVSRMVDMGQTLGITTWNNPSRFGLALTLGGGEVTLADMAVVYGTFANYGLKVNLHPIKEVTNYSGTQHDQLGCDDIPTKLAFPEPAQALNQSDPCQALPVISESTAFIISDILSDINARTPTFGRHSILNIKDHQVAVKTGTTNNLRDNWTIGYTQNILVGVWVGNNDNTPMSRIASGITGASPIWNTIMTKVLEDKPQQTFPVPPSIVKTNICPLTASLSCNACPNPKIEYFAKGTEPTKACNEEIIKRIVEEQQKRSEELKQN
jgi:membrane carboxypeptidase/penicillin-binding protein